MEIKNQIKYLILAAVFLCLIFPQPVLALVVEDITAIPNQILEGIEEAVGELMKWEFLITVTNIIALFLASFSAWLLEYVTENTPQWLSVQDNAMVFTGWQFTSGLANLFIVLALIFIAFGFILKIESWESKKALPRLIIVALLVNFSLVFIGALVDISNILFNTFLAAGGTGLPSKTFQMLGGSLAGLISKFIIAFLALAAAFAIPIGNAAAQLAKALTVEIFFLPFVLDSLIQSLLAVAIASMFFLYAFLFACRIYMIQMLAIVSPIFFLCWALPPFKKYWDEWFGMLMEWLFFGVILYFFLVLGLKASAALLPPTWAPGGIPVIGLTIIPFASVSYYFFLFVYLMGVMYYVTSRVMPVMGKALIAGGAAMAGTMTAASGPLLTALKTVSREKLTTMREEEKKTERLEKEEKEGLELTKEEKEELDKAKTGWGKLKREFKGGLTKTADALYGLGGTSLEEQARKAMAEVKKKAEQTKEIPRLLQLAERSRGRGRLEQAAMVDDEIFARNPGYKGAEMVRQTTRFKDRKGRLVKEGELPELVKKGELTEEEIEEQIQKRREELEKESNVVTALGETKVGGRIARKLGATSLLQTHGRLTKREGRDFYETFAKEELSAEDQEKITQEITMPEKERGKYKDEEEYKKEAMLRLIQMVRLTDKPEVRDWTPDAIKRIAPISSRLWPVELDLEGTRQFRLDYPKETMNYLEKLGAVGTMLKLSSEKLLQLRSVPSQIAGLTIPGKLEDETFFNWLRQRQSFDEDQLKNANEVFEALHIEDRQKELDEMLTKRPDYLKELGTKEIGAVRTDLENWKRRRKTAEVSLEAIEEKIKGLEEEKRKEEGKIEIGEAPDVKKIRELRERIRKLKRDLEIEE